MQILSRRPAAWLRQPAFVLLAILVHGQASAALDLGNASVHRLDNGLTVVLLEDRNFPVVSVQMLYKVGARNEVTGKTGLAHFVEHMAFRATENFPDTGVVSRIYARGGEWHGYTWTDQTTYFATAPKDELDLLLRIEADRMGRLQIDVDDIDAERGAVLAEMHMYENDPTSSLIDALMFTSFLAHPYRNNTIGFEDDIESVTHADVVRFYEQHYHPANGVLAVVGYFDAEAALNRIRELFGGFEHRPATPLPHTREPPQTGVRRIEIRGVPPERRFMIAYRAPAFAHPDFPAFLVLQEILGGGSGVSFLQNDWGTPVNSSAVLHGLGENMTSWLPPSAQDYVFVIGGRPADGQSQPELEQAIEHRLETVHETTLSGQRVAAAVSGVLDELVFDVQTTEDAAHQLAFYAGFDALDELLELPARVEAITADELVRVARHYLKPEKRTIAWYRQAEQPRMRMRRSDAARRPVSSARPEPRASDDSPLLPPVTARVGRGIPAVIKTSDISSSVYLKLVFQGQSSAQSEFVTADPIAGFSAWNRLMRPSRLASAIDEALAYSAAYRPARQIQAALSLDPERRMQQEFASILGLDVPAVPEHPVPSLIVVAGDIDAQTAQRLLESSFGKLDPPKQVSVRRNPIRHGERTVNLGLPVAQARLGYIVAAPAPDDPDYDAYRLLLYIVSHGYEGRLGKEAISRRGLAYYIDARYHSFGGPGWITLDAGVDPGKLEQLKRVLDEEFRRLETHPPTPAELEEAKNHLLGRAVSAAQSNEELAGALARDWLWYGEIPSVDSLRRRLRHTDLDGVRRVTPAFTDGLTILVAP